MPDAQKERSHPPSVSSPIVRSPLVEWQVKRETADCPQKSELGPPRNWYMHIHTPQWLNREGQPLDCWVFFLSLSLPLCLVSDPSILALFSVFCSPHKDIEERERAERESGRETEDERNARRLNLFCGALHAGHGETSTHSIKLSDTHIQAAEGEALCCPGGQFKSTSHFLPSLPNFFSTLT